MSGGDVNLRLEPPPAAPPRLPDVYEWEITIQAPFAFDFLKLVRSLFQLPKRRPSGSDPVAPGSRRSWYLHVFLYNLGRIALILGMIPFTMLAFSYVATLPFLVMRGLENWLGPGPVAVIAGLGLVLSLLLPVWVVLQWFKPNWVRESYKKSKVELYNILIYLGLFLAAGMLETLIASPVLPFRGDFAGPVDSTPQWTLFFADLSMNVLFAHLPQKLFGAISDIRLEEPGRIPVSLGLLRLLLIVGFVTLVRLLFMKLCLNKTELFVGTREEVKAYLPYCGRAMARPIRKVIPLPLSDEELAMTESFRFRMEPNDDGPGSAAAGSGPAGPERRGTVGEDGLGCPD
ncbi:MAG: hypothetical protein KatS3mg108_1375 [Isosphaeraceae bacterium]|jgi:hypothetical protein|nr:MAG: hypothetical protein KatS3mg108_1375 [Isosphaeraceae bacterium]